MTVAQYKIWATGEAVGQGATGSVHVGVAAIAKRNLPGQPYIVPNELVCAQLAVACRLPIPPGFIVQHEGQSAFVSMNFNLAGENLPPVDPAALVAAHPRTAWGIVLIDIWMCNGDRHSQNLSYNAATNAVQIFDHSHALLGQQGIGHLQANSNATAIGGHCLATQLTAVAGAEDWHSRIAAVPEYVVREVCRDAASLGAEAFDGDAVAHLLLDRRKRLKALINASHGSFPQVTDWQNWT
jgi:hypothetical protein